MKCKYSEDILSRYVDGALPGRLLKAVSEHLSKCSRCRLEVEKMAKLNDMLEALPEAVESEHFDFEFNRKLAAAIAEKEKENILVNVLRGIAETVEQAGDLFMPRVPVLVRSAIAAIFIVGAFLTGQYYNETDMPLLTAVKGEVFILNKEDNTWHAADENITLEEGSVIRSAGLSEANIELSSKYHMRLKSDTTIKLARLSPKRRSGKFSVELEKGDILVDIERGFKGSRFQVRTEEARVRALGTKFMVAQKNKKTWIGVLKGSVKVGPGQKILKLAKAVSDVTVNAGMKTEVPHKELPARPTPLLMKDWEQMKELYMIGEKTRVALFISNDKTRVLGLLSPCAIYITDEKPRKIPAQLEEAAYYIYRAIKENNNILHMKGISKLEEIVKKDRTADYNVQLLLYIGAYYNFLELHSKAIAAFNEVIRDHPDSPLVSLALCAKAYIREKSFNDFSGAKRLYRKIIEEYADSPEAQFAHERLGLLAPEETGTTHA